MPVELWPVMQHRMEAFRDEPALGRLAADQPRAGRPGARAGPRRAAPHRPRPRRRRCRRAKVDWGWNWSEARKALDYLFLVGDLAIAGRNSPVRAGLRPARAGAAGRRSWRRRSPTRRGRPRSWSGGRRAATGSPRSAACRLLPAPAPARRGQQAAPAGDRRAGRGGRAAAGDRRGLEAPGVAPPRRRAAAQGRRPRPAEPLRPGRVGARAHRAPLRLPLPHRDLRARAQAAATATTCCRSCSATGSSAASTSRPTARRARLLVKAATPSRVRPPRRRPSWPRSCATSPAGSGSTTSWCTHKGDLATALDAVVSG